MRRREKDTGKSVKVWMSVFLALTMILSAFGILLNSDSNELKYGKYKVTRSNSIYTTKIGGEEVYFYALPYEVSYINISDVANSKLKSSVYVVTTFDPSSSNESTSAIELVRFDLAKFMKGKYIVNAVMSSTSAYSALPVLGCENATAGSPVVVFNVSDTTSVNVVGECIYLNAKGVDFLRIRDKLLYSYFGVLNETAS
jgi:hypothetical protein